MEIRIPYEERGIISTVLMPLKFNNKSKAWECSDTLASRYNCNNGLSKYCSEKYEMPDKFKEYEIVQKTKAWDHQKKAFDVVNNLDSSYLYMLPGSGKTKVIIDYHNTNKPQFSLILCPKNVINTWVRQFETHGIYDEKRQIFPLEKGSSDKKDKVINDIIKWGKNIVTRCVIIVNYETSWRLQSLSKCKFNLIVFDEIHRLQSSSTNVTKFCSKLNGVKKVGLTGTPGEPSKWHGQFLCLDENLFGRNRKKFYEKFFSVDYFGNPAKVRDMDKLKEHFNLLSYVVDNQAVLNIPEPTHDIITIGNKSKKEYKQIENEFMLDVKNGVITVANAMVKSLKLRQICSGFILDEAREIVELNTAKQDALSEFLEDNQENIIVFYNFQHEAEQIKKACKSRNFAQISGQRRDMEAISNPEKGTVLAIQIRAGGTGIDGLQNNYKYCVYYSLSWSEIDHEQSMRRLYRAGQKESVHFYYFIVQGTVEEKVLKSLKNKQNVIKEILC